MFFLFCFPFWMKLCFPLTEFSVLSVSAEQRVSSRCILRTAHLNMTGSYRCQAATNNDDESSSKATRLSSKIKKNYNFEEKRVCIISKLYWRKEFKDWTKKQQHLLESLLSKRFCYKAKNFPSKIKKLRQINEHLYAWFKFSVNEYKLHHQTDWHSPIELWSECQRDWNWERYCVGESLEAWPGWVLGSWGEINQDLLFAEKNREKNLGSSH